MSLTHTWLDVESDKVLVEGVNFYYSHSTRAGHVRGLDCTDSGVVSSSFISFHQKNNLCTRILSSRYLYHSNSFRLVVRESIQPRKRKKDVRNGSRLPRSPRRSEERLRGGRCSYRLICPSTSNEKSQRLN